ncbi:hypothetical protein [Photobacterium sanguinicancri]|uniref:hypothetical protein n=1 Tax=Photobacterium sanguinicancri TaxID=875932 RepID=UPI003D09FCA2
MLLRTNNADFYLLDGRPAHCDGRLVMLLKQNELNDIIATKLTETEALQLISEDVPFQCGVDSVVPFKGELNATN